MAAGKERALVGLLLFSIAYCFVPYAPGIATKRLITYRECSNREASGPLSARGDNYENLTVLQLRALLASRGGKPRQLRRAELLAELRQSDSFPMDTTQGVDIGRGEEEGRLQYDKAATALGRRSRMPSLSIEESAIEIQGTDVGTRIDGEVGRWRNALRSYPSDSPQGRLAALPPDESKSEAVRDDFVNRSTLVPRWTESNLELHFIGTASCIPSVTRGVSCTVVRRDGSFMVFDAGEGTQTTLQRSNVSPKRIDRIFVTHVHGDHSFGLTGLLCLMGQDREKGDNDYVAVDIYGPVGLRAYLRASTQLTQSRVVARYRVHELHGVPWLMDLPPHMAPPPPPDVCAMGLAMDSKFGEAPGGVDIWPKDGLWTLVDEMNGLGVIGSHDWDGKSGQRKRGKKQKQKTNERDATPDGLVVRAAPMVHTVPCVGFVVEERARPGRLNAEKVRPLIQANLEELKSKGYSDPMKLMKAFKKMKRTDKFLFPDGTILRGDVAVSPPRRGRKIVICGDTSDARAIAPAAMNADVLVHEATNAYIPGLDKGTTREAVRRASISHGHSTPEIAGDFARSIRARRLVLHHFSPRYKGDTHRNSVYNMLQIEELASRAAGLPLGDVVAAWDLMSLHIPQSEDEV